jgi:hypothetical protein
MQEFLRKFTQLNGVEAKVLVEHCLFDKQVFLCDELQTINDDRIGLMLKGREIFMYKHNVKVADWSGKVCNISDGRLTITIICK